MQQTIDTMITMEEYLRKRNVIKGNEQEEKEHTADRRGRDRKGLREEDGRVNPMHGCPMLALAELMLI